MSLNITHHVNDELLMEYSAGTLPEAYALVVAAHISVCKSCRTRMEQLDALGGALLESATDDVAPMGDTAPMSDDSLAATLAMIQGITPEPRKAPCAANPNSVLPKPVRDYVGGDVDAVKWRGLKRGVRQAILPTSGEGTARLLYIPAGMAVPDHSHQGVELTLVLQGSFSDEIDSFRRGDIEIADDDTEHKPVAGMEADCICLAATDAPLKFNGLIPKLIQPMFRI